MCQERPHGPGIHGLRMAAFGVPCHGGNEMRNFGQMMKKHGHGFIRHYEGWVPYNLEVLEDSYEITVPLSGRSKEDVEVSLIGRSINITARKPKTTEKETKSTEDKSKSDMRSIPFLRNLFTFVNVNMDIPLPADADENSIKSTMQNGLLRVKIWKKTPKDINIENTNN